MKSLADFYDEFRPELRLPIAAVLNSNELRILFQSRKEEIQKEKAELNPFMKTFQRDFIELHHAEQFCTEVLDLIEKARYEFTGES